MPLTPEQAQKALSLAKLDPSQWDVSADGNHFVRKQIVTQSQVEAPKEDDVDLNPVMDTSKSDSPLITAGKTALDAAPSAAAGGVGAASTLAMLGGLGLDMTGVGAVVGIPLTLLGGGLAAYGTRKAQNKLLPMVDPSYQPDLDKSQSTNPNAAAVGDIAAIPLGGFNPSLAPIRAVGGLGKLAVGMRPTAGEVSDIMNTGVGAVGSGVGVAAQGDLNPKDIAEAALTGGVFSSPNSIGRRLGFQNHQQPNQINDPQALRDSLINGTSTEQKQTSPTTSNEEQLNPITANDVTTTAGLNPNAPEFQTAEQTALAKYKASPDDGQEKLMEGEGGIVPVTDDSVDAQVKAAVDPTNPRAAVLQVEGEKSPENEVLNYVHTPQGKVAFNPNKTTAKEVLEQFSQPNGGGKLLGMSTETKVATPESVAVTAKNENGTPVTDEVVTPEQVPAAVEHHAATSDDVEVKPVADVLAQRDPAIAQAQAALDALNNKKYQPTTSLSGEVSGKLKEEGLPVKPTVEWYNMLKKFGADMKGVTTSSDGNLVHEVTKQPVNGVATIQDGLRQIIVNPNRAAVDTQPHELFHIFMHDMENSSSMKDKALTRRLVELTKQSPEYMKQHPDGGTVEDVDEFITSQQGLEFLKQQLNLNKESPVTKWWNDFKSHISVKYGKDSNIEDVRRLMNYKFVNDKVKVINGHAASGQMYQQQTEDGKRYEELGQVMEKADFGSEEYMKAWKEREEIKNRHEGKTPEHGQYQEESELNPKTSKPYSAKQARNRAADREAFGEIPDRKNARFVRHETTEEHKRTPIDIKKDDVFNKETSQTTNATLDTINKVANSKLNWLYSMFQKNTGKDFDVQHNKSGRDYLVVPKNLRRSELLSRLQENIIQHGVDHDGLIPTVRRRIRTIFDKAIADYKPEVSLNKKSEVTGNELGDTIAAPQKGAVELPEKVHQEAPVVDKTEVKAPVKVKQEKVEVNKASMTAGEMLTALENMGVDNESLLQHLESMDVDAEIKDPKALIAKFNAFVEDTRYQEDSNLRQDLKDKYDKANEIVLEIQTRPFKIGDQVRLRDGHTGSVLKMDNDKVLVSGRRLLDIPDQWKNTNSIEHIELKHAKQDAQFAYDSFIKENTKDNVNKYQEASPIKTEETQHASSKLIYRALKVKPALEVLRDSAGEKGQKLAIAFEQYFKDRNTLYGRYFNPIAIAAKGMEESGVKRVEKILLEENKTGVVMRDQLFGKQLKLYDTIRNSLLQKQQEQIAAGQKVTAFDANNRPFQRDAQVNPTYFPNKISPKVIEDITEHHANRSKLLQDFIDHTVANDDSNRPTEKKLELAREKLDNLLMGFEGESSNQTKFNANRISEGIGLPDSWMRSGLLKNLSSYFNKVSNDRSFYDNVEGKDDIAPLIDPRNPDGIYHNAKDVIDQVKGESFDKDVGALKAYNRIATSAMLGPLTNIHISLSTFANALQYLKPLESPQAYLHALSDVKGFYKKALETGYARHDLTSIKDLQDANNTHLEKLKEVSTIIGKVGGRQVSDTMTKAFAQGISDFIVRVRRVEANNGDKHAQMVMKQVDPSWTKDKQYKKEEFDQMASVMAGFMHGAHDARTLPTWMLKESWIQPFMSLMSWSVAQTNQWMKHVWEPATKGNFNPLLMSTFGAVTGGYIIQQLRQKVADKKSAIPSLQEIAASKKGIAGNPELLAYNFMQMASYTGWAGIAATLGKDAFDLAYKNMPQGSTFPLDEAIEGTVETAGEAFSAMMQAHSAQDVIDIAKKAGFDLVKENVQTARIAANWGAASGVLGEAQEQAKTVNESSGDMRRYEIANQLPYDQQILNNNNPYLHLDEKAFKRTGDIGEAAGMIPQLVQDEIQESNGNMEVAKEKIAGLKQNSYQTMPNPQREPVQFARYYQYLQQTLGPQAASERMMDYMRHNAMNHLKSNLIPLI